MAMPVQYMVDRNDTDEMRSPLGWITDAGIREVVRRHGSNVNDHDDLTKKINFIDPTWLCSWEKDSRLPSSEVLQIFLQKHVGGVVGCVMPYNYFNNHWERHDYIYFVVIYVNFEAGGAILFNSSHNPIITQHIRVLLDRFHETFRFLFEDHHLYGNKFQFVEDMQCVQQSDGSSCGIYAVRNILDLLDHRRPSGERLTPAEIAAFRRNGGIILEAALP